MKFLIGCNYWDSAHGTEMWRFFDEQIIRDDIAALAKCGVKCMRVFPNWRDFQPVKGCTASANLQTSAENMALTLW